MKTCCSYSCGPHAVAEAEFNSEQVVTNTQKNLGTDQREAAASLEKSMLTLQLYGLTLCLTLSFCLHFFHVFGKKIPPSLPPPPLAAPDRPVAMSSALIVWLDWYLEEGRGGVSHSSDSSVLTCGTTQPRNLTARAAAGWMIPVFTLQHARGE